MELETSIAGVARDRETPFFLFFEEILDELAARVTRSFESDFEVRLDYSVKTNRERALLERIARHGFAAEVSGAWELEHARISGFDATKAAVDGPYHPPSEFAQMLAAPPRMFFLDSADEATRLEEAAENSERTPFAGLRVAGGAGFWTASPGELAHGRFGTPQAEVPALARAIASRGKLRLAALSAHLGTQIASARPYVRAMVRLVELARSLESAGIALDEIHLGGGLPSATLAKRSLFDIAFFLRRPRRARRPSHPAPDPLPAIGRSIVEAFRELRRRLRRPPALGIAPGRALVSQAGFLVSRIRAVKGRWAFTDASRDFLPEATVFANHRARVIPASGSRSVHLAGTSLSSSDVLALAARIGPVKPGDLVVFEDAGAYSLSRLTRFQPGPAAYLVTRSGDVALIRRKETTLEDLARPMVG